MKMAARSKMVEETNMMKEIKKVKVLKVKMTEAKGTDKGMIREKELICMMNMQEKMKRIRGEQIKMMKGDKEIMKMAARSKMVEETNMMKEDKIVEEIKINQSMTLAMIDTKVQWIMNMMAMVTMTT